MLLQIRSQGFPGLIDELGISSPLQGPFWQFESTVLPIIDVRGAKNLPRSGVVYDLFSTAGELATPTAGDFLATTNTLFKPGAWALRFSWAFANNSAGSAFLAIQRLNDTFTVVLEQEIVEAIGGTTLGMNRVGSGFTEMVLQKNTFGEPWGLRILQTLATAGSVVVGSIRARYLGEVSGPEGF